jgi:hypothetical protein
MHWNRLTGRFPVHESTKQTFQVAARFLMSAEEQISPHAIAGHGVIVVRDRESATIPCSGKSFEVLLKEFQKCRSLATRSSAGEVSDRPM